MARQRGSRATNKSRRRTLPTSPLQKALEPGSQDDLRPEGAPFSPLQPPVTPVVGGVGVSPDLDNNNNNIPSPNAEFCRPDSEPLEYQHRELAAIAQHLEHFLRHHAAWSVVSEYGPDLVNAALQELPHTDGVNNPAGWLNWRVKELARGVPPMPAPQAKKDRHQVEREKAQRDYERRWAQEEPADLG